MAAFIRWRRTITTRTLLAVSVRQGFGGRFIRSRFRADIAPRGNVRAGTPAHPGPAFGGFGVCVSRARLDAVGAGGQGAAVALPRRRRAWRKRAGRMPAVPGPAFGGVGVSVQALSIAAVSVVPGGRGAGSWGARSGAGACVWRRGFGGRGAVGPGGSGGRLRGIAGLRRARGGRARLPCRHRALRKRAGETPAHPGSPRLRRDLWGKRNPAEGGARDRGHPCPHAGDPHNCRRVGCGALPGCAGVSPARLRPHECRRAGREDRAPTANAAARGNVRAGTPAHPGPAFGGVSISVQIPRAPYRRRAIASLEQAARPTRWSACCRAACPRRWRSTAARPRPRCGLRRETRRRFRRAPPTRLPCGMTTAMDALPARRRGAESHAPRFCAVRRRLLDPAYPPAASTSESPVPARYSANRIACFTKRPRPPDRRRIADRPSSR